VLVVSPSGDSGASPCCLAWRRHCWRGDLVRSARGHQATSMGIDAESVVVMVGACVNAAHAAGAAGSIRRLAMFAYDFAIAGTTCPRC